MRRLYLGRSGSQCMLFILGARARGAAGARGGAAGGAARRGALGPAGQSADVRCCLCTLLRE
ncbi:hypothetical protein JYU34_011135 [Plutella xylostella]|uniref:Uncharacterized protein n=1 Tax=Plutella xylostella TaxID=51655 RepID=A0ABQ7QG79_PLUXY|nr:hypothetical protein JYU34_011135 [Plutella xylostella]